jgi:hypothetical protein
VIPGDPSSSAEALEYDIAEAVGYRSLDRSVWA